MILGCMNFGKANWGISRDDAQTVLNMAYECGIRAFDTASFYAEGASERILGSWIRDRGCRDSVQVMSKAGGGNPDHPNMKGLSSHCLIGSTESSLCRLGVDWLDVLTLHWPDPNAEIDDTLDGVSVLLERGLIKEWALSNFYTGEMVRILERAQARSMPLPRYSHVHLNLLEQHALREMIPESNQYGVSSLAWSPFCGGILYSGFHDTNARFHAEGSFWKRYCEGPWIDRRSRIVSLSRDYGVSLECLVC